MHDSFQSHICQVSPLHYAARHNHLEVITMLVDHGGDVNIRGDDGLTPLHYAARFKINPQAYRKESRGMLITTYCPEKPQGQFFPSPLLLT